MLKKLIPVGLASLMTVTALIPATTTPAEARRGGAMVADMIGLTAGAIVREFQPRQCLRASPLARSL